MPAPRSVIDELRKEYKHRRMVAYVLREMTVDNINYVYAVHSAIDATDPDVALYMDAIDDYLDEWYPIQK